MPAMARRPVPKTDQTMATITSAWGTAPMIGSSWTCTESAQRMGRKAISVITKSIRLTPRPSMIEAKRIVSSWTRCEAPSMWRSRCQLAT